MEFGYVLLNLAPFVPLLLLAGVSAYWLRTSRTAWIAAGLIAVCVPGVILTWFLRDMGYHAYGDRCVGEARAFMEAMQLVFLLQAATGFAGSLLLGAVAIRKNRTIGVVSILALGFVSLLTAFFIYFAAGMTAVDGYRC